MIKEGLENLKAKGVGMYNQCLHRARVGLVCCLVKDNEGLERISGQLSRMWASKGQGEGEAEKSAEYLDLTPSVQAGSDCPYSLRLEDFLTRPLVNGIAVTGGYGTGKSSFLHSFFQQEGRPSHIVITLGCYGASSNAQVVQSAYPDASVDGCSEEEVRRLETAVLKQILYRQADDTDRALRLRDAGCPGISGGDWLRAFLLAALLMGGLTGMIAGREEVWAWLYGLMTSDSGFVLVAVVLCGLTLLGVIAYFFTDVLGLMRKVRLSKINPISGELELDHAGSQPESLFNRHLEELLVYFGNSGVEVVIFEDMDRFKGTAIFERLKELNKIINDSDKVRQHVRFIYAVREDVFQLNTDKTKFFDANISILPVVSPFNAKGHLQAELERAGLWMGSWDWEQKKKPLISLITLHIQDMRMLKSLVADLQCHMDVLRADWPNETTEQGQRGGETQAILFSYCAYKVFYPNDFAKMLTGQGVLGQLEAMGKVVAGLRSDVARNKRENIEETLAELAQERFDGADELGHLLRSKLLELRPGSGLAQSNLNGVQLNSAPEDFLKKVLGLNGQTAVQLVFANQYVNNHGHRNVDGLLDAMVPNIRLRAKRLAEKETETVATLQEEVIALERKIAAIAVAEASSWISAIEGEDLLAGKHEHIDALNVWYEELKAMPLLRALLLNGDLRENHKNYTSRAKPGALTAQDYEFLRALTGGGEYYAGYLCTDYSEILPDLRINNARSPAAYNHGLVCHLHESLEAGDGPNRALLDAIIDAHYNLKGDCAERLVALHTVAKERAFSYVARHCNYAIDSLADLAGDDERSVLSVIFAVLGEQANLGGSVIILESTTDSLQAKIDNDPKALLVALARGPKFFKQIADGMGDYGVRFKNLGGAHLDPSVIPTAVKEEVVELNRATLPVVAGFYGGTEAPSLPVRYRDLPSNKKGFQAYLAIPENSTRFARMILEGQVLAVPDGAVFELAKVLEVECEVLKLTPETLIGEASFEVDDTSAWLEAPLHLASAFKKRKVSPKWGNVIEALRFGGDDVDVKAALDAAICLFMSDPTVKPALLESVDGLDEDVRADLCKAIEMGRIPLEVGFDYHVMMADPFEAEALRSMSREEIERYQGTRMLKPDEETIRVLIEKGLVHKAAQLVLDHVDNLFKDGVWRIGLGPYAGLAETLITSAKLSKEQLFTLISEGAVSAKALAESPLVRRLILPPVGEVELPEGKPLKHDEVAMDCAEQAGLAFEVPMIPENILSALLVDNALSKDYKFRVLIGQAKHHASAIWDFTRQAMGETSDVKGMKGLTLADSNLGRALGVAMVQAGAISSVSLRGGGVVAYNAYRQGPVPA
ncbi:hypothetical protein [Ferrimonas balearica]|uniref:YobI family P-loop NTPase n=1 Tax=Ferrimonas balearica TaxID=44012 RepID=UPI001C992647|nr:hypothetical protein [Ferrimonas balearica]MBY5920212.1 hypothetical protein [Ferrimonas balearica]MBY5997103.1 hypothetical protein [Ferrimonas balearica]